MIPESAITCLNENVRSSLPPAVTLFAHAYRRKSLKIYAKNSPNMCASDAIRTKRHNDKCFDFIRHSIRAIALIFLQRCMTRKRRQESFSVNFRLILFVVFGSIGLSSFSHFNACNGNQWQQEDNGNAAMCSIAFEC